MESISELERGDWLSDGMEYHLREAMARDAGLTLLDFRRT